MEKKKIVTLGTTLCAIVLFVGIDVKTGCACIDQDGLVMRETESLITKTKTNTGTYPTYDEVSKAVQFGTLNEYKGVRPETAGIYYAPSPSGDEYVLRRYADVNLFGIKTPYLWEV